MHLVYRDAIGVPQSIPIDGLPEVTLGRGPERHLVLDGRQVSRHHASIERVSGSSLLRDHGSANGTFLNGLRLSGTSAIALRDGDVIEIGAYRICYAADVELARAKLEPPTDEAENAFIEAIHHHSDLLRDGITWTHEHEPDEASGEILRSFSGPSLATGIVATLEHLKSRLRVDVAAAFVKRRNRGALELVAARPDDVRGKTLATTFDLGQGDIPRLFYRVHPSSVPARRRTTPLSETCSEPQEHSAALVPFFRGESLLGVLAVERVRGPRIDRKHASIVAVYGERISRALSLRLANSSDNDTAFDLAGGAA